MLSRLSPLRSPSLCPWDIPWKVPSRSSPRPPRLFRSSRAVRKSSWFSNSKGHSVSVKDANNNSLAFKALVKGVTVYVSRSPDKKTVIVFVMPLVKKENKNV